MPAARLEVVTWSVGSSTVRLRAWLSVALLLSVTVTVKSKVPTAVGAPAKTPFAPRVTPAGNVPVVTAKVRGVTPPLARTDAL
ncbi:hypothetical protein D3C75_1056710 [compost metagenome]